MGSKFCEDFQGMEEDHSTLLSVFPVEVWDKVFKKVNHLKSYYTIRRTSPFFQNFPTPSKIVTLQSTIISCLLEHLKHDEKAHILKLRLVCKDWKFVLDSMLSTVVPLQIYTKYVSGLYVESSLGIPSKWITTFRKSQDFLDFYDKTNGDNLQLESANPLLTRSVFFTFPDVNLTASDSEQETYLQESVKFLQQFCQHVWYLELNVAFEHWRWKRFCEWFYNVLEHLENVKIIWCKHETYHNVINQLIYKLQMLANEDILTREDIIEYLESNDQLNLSDESSRKMKPQDTILEINDLSTKIDSFSHLSELSQLINNFYFSVERKVMNFWYVSPAAGWGLSTLDLTPDFPVPWRKINLVSWQTLFQTLERFGETLRVLKVPLPSLNSTDHSAKLDLPNLKVLGIRMQFGKTLDFILPMAKSLQDLSVQVDATFPVDRTGQNTIRFFWCMDNPYQSNIWQIVPSLQHINIHARCSKNVYSRELWKASSGVK